MSDYAELVACALREGIDPVDLPVRAPTFDRLVPLRGAMNVRDAGGYATTSGQTMRTGLIYRADHLSELTDADLTIMSAIGFQSIHDFRLDSELERQPSRLPSNAPTVTRLGTSDFTTFDGAMIDVVRDIIAGLRPVPEGNFWVDNYLDIITNSPQMFIGFLRSIATPGHLPELHHCTGGKDRTGLTTALLHKLLEVDDADAIDDFLLTNVYRTAKRIGQLREPMADKGVRVEDTIPIIGVTRTPIELVLQAWEDGGGAEAYALDNGFTASELASLRDSLLS